MRWYPIEKLREECGSQYIVVYSPSGEVASSKSEGERQRFHPIPLSLCSPLNCDVFSSEGFHLISERLSWINNQWEGRGREERKLNPLASFWVQFLICKLTCPSTMVLSHINFAGQGGLLLSEMFFAEAEISSQNCQWLYYSRLTLSS